VSRLRLTLLLASLVLIPGCSPLRGLTNPAGRLLEQGRAAFDAHDLDLAYDRFAEIRRRHLESAEAREAFPAAAAIFRHGYFHDRYRQPDSRWLTTEPRFMLEWLQSYLDGPEFPQAEAEALFTGMPYGYFREYLALAAARPEPQHWRFRAEDDNGIIEAIVLEAPAR